MKRIVVFLLTAVFVLSFAGCGSTEIAPEVSTTVEGFFDIELEGDEYIELGNYKGLKLTKVTNAVSEEEIEESIRELCEGMADYEDIDDRDVVQDQDFVAVAILCKIDGKVNENYSEEDTRFQIGSGAYVYGEDCDLETPLIGVKVGETVKVEGTIDSEYYDDDVAGKKASFAVTVNAIQKEVLPEINDDLIRENTEYDSLAEYKEAMRKELEDNNDYDNLQDMYDDMWAQIIGNCKMKKEFPKEIVEKETKNISIMHEEMADFLGMEMDEYMQENYGMSLEEYALFSLKSDCAKKMLKEKESISLSSGQLNEKIKDFVKEYGYDSVDAVLAQYSEEDLKEEFEWEMLMEKLAGYSEITEVSNN